jgi:hypothetical protein
MNRNVIEKVMVSRPRQNGRKRQGMTRRSVAIIPRPGPIPSYEITRSKVLRFISSTAVGKVITYQNLLDTVLFTTSATAPYDLFYMVRVKKLTIWCLGSIGTTESVQVVFDGTTAGSQGDRTIHSAQSMGIEPAYLTCRPNKKSLAADFQISSAATCFTLTVPVGAVIDLHCDFKSDTLGVPIAAQNVSAASNVGVVAYRGLDGLASSTTVLAPPSGVYTV